ncbi:MAG TPA: hypothetical protein PLQ36_03040, partial [Candidatus Gracilibacteria bacterium]|nr:hypothetical protein [Candidatus Gracilibacteria bacterium]
MYKKGLSCVLIGLILLGLVPFSEVQASRIVYPAEGYCQKFQTEYNFQTEKVPNYPLSSYLEGLGVKAQHEELLKIKIDQNCIDQAKLNEKQRRTQDQTTRQQIQQELQHLKSLAERLHQEKKEQEERAEFWDKFSASLRNIDQGEKELARKTLIDERSIVLDQIHSAKQEQDEAIKAELPQKVARLKEMLATYQTQTPAQGKAYLAQIKSELSESLGELKQEFLALTRAQTEQASEFLQIILNQEQEDYQASLATSGLSETEQEIAQSSYLQIQGERRTYYQELISEFVQSSQLELKSLLDLGESVLGKQLSQKGDLVTANWTGGEVLQNSSMRIANQFSGQNFQVAEMQALMRELNSLVQSAEFSFLRITKNPQLTSQALQYLDQDQHAELASLLENLDQEQVQQINQAYEQEKTQIQKLNTAKLPLEKRKLPSLKSPVLCGNELRKALQDLKVTTSLADCQANSQIKYDKDLVSAGAIYRYSPARKIVIKAIKSTGKTESINFLDKNSKIQIQIDQFFATFYHYDELGRLIEKVKIAPTLAWKKEAKIFQKPQTYNSKNEFFYAGGGAQIQTRRDYGENSKYPTKTTSYTYSGNKIRFIKIQNSESQVLAQVEFKYDQLGQLVLIQENKKGVKRDI